MPITDSDKHSDTDGGDTMEPCNRSRKKRFNDEHLVNEIKIGNIYMFIYCHYIAIGTQKTFQHSKGSFNKLDNNMFFSSSIFGRT